MAQRINRTTIVKEELEPTNGDPIAVTIRGFLYEGEPLPEDLAGQYEFRLKVQQLDRRGRVVHGVKHESDQLGDLFDEILDELGPGRYTIWVSYRRAGDAGKYSLVKAQDIQVSDGQPPSILDVKNPASPESPHDRRDILTVMMAMMQQQNQVSMAQMQQMTQILVAALTGKQSQGTDAKTILEAVSLGRDLAPSNNNPDDPTDRMWQMGGELLKLLTGKKAGESVPVEDLQRITEAAGVHEALRDQGFEEEAR